ncbi:hypothetical protein LCGC14_1089980 [marine sediment metagenome]|uniref:Uncharacterized protein n=1 Tax=marine sediment metagenome TaxID=412755 RepID=A0A0F9N0A4_9ZZZZ
MILEPEIIPQPKGEVIIELKDGYGNVISMVRRNLVVDIFRERQSDWAAADFTETIDEIHIGSGGHVGGDPNTPIPPTVSDTALDVSEATKTVSSTTQPTTKSTQYSVSFSTADVSDPTGITEAGLFTSPGGFMVARVTFPEQIITGILTLTVTWKLIF